jgi:hypothetical protein
MLGVQRTSVGLIANSLQRTGAIRYTRGRVEIIDLERVRSLACACYRIVREENENFAAENERLASAEVFTSMSDIRQTTAMV